MGSPIQYCNRGDTFDSMVAIGIGSRVRSRRKDVGLRQSDLATLVEVDQSVISDIENGRGFGSDVLMRLCEHLRTTPEYVMNGTHRDEPGEAEMVAIFRQLTIPQRDAMLAMARGLATQSGGSTASQPKRKAAQKQA